MSKEESRLFTIKIKRTIISKGILNWPSNKLLSEINKVVFNKQIELVNLAEKFGRYSNSVHKQQLLLVNSLFFRIVAVEKLVKSRGSRTASVFNLSFSSNRKKASVLVMLVEWLQEVLQKSGAYQPGLVKYV